MALLLLGGLLLAASLAPSFLLILLGYLLLTLAYTFYAKQLVLIDVLMLALLYTIRIMAGAMVINVAISSWLLAFSMFTFLSLALIKRRAELGTVESLERTNTEGRDYQLTDAPVINSMGISAGYLAVLVLALYVDTNSPAVSTHYSHPRLLWLLCPLMLYWISRLWIKTSRGEMHDDPFVHRLQDIGSWMVFLAMTCVTLIAI